MANGVQVPTGITILNSYLGYHGISLTNFENDSVPSVASGSKIEIAGAFFSFSADDTIDATTWAAISTGSKAYICLTPSGTAGSQILTATWSSTEPVYSTSKQGYYTSAGSNVRVVGGCTKTGSSTYNRKFILQNHQKDRRIETFTSSGTWIAPPNVYEVYVTGCAAGGNGGSGGNGNSASDFNDGGGGGGGGAGQHCIKTKISVVPSTAYSITIGSIGSNTTFSTSLTLICGGNGGNGNNGSGGSAGSGGTGGTGGGGAGGNGAGSGSANSGSNGSGQWSGSGGSGGALGGGGGGGGAKSYFDSTLTSPNGGSGGVGSGSGSSGIAATSYGSGGGGGGGGGASGGVAGTGGSGGAGGAAILIIEW